MVKRFPTFSFANGEEESATVNTSTTTPAAVSSDTHGLIARIPPSNGPWLDPEIFVAAAGEGDISTLQSLLSHHTIDINGVSSDCGDTAMHKAAWNGHLDVVRLLVIQGAKTDVANAYGTTPMHWAAAQDHLDVVECLVESGRADPEKTNDCGWTPLHEASFNGHLAVVEYLTSINVHRTSTSSASSSSSSPSSSSMLSSPWITTDKIDPIPEQTEPSSSTRSKSKDKDKGRDRTLSATTIRNTVG